MSGTAAVSTQFTSATSATGAQLDGNFSTIVAYINDPTNRNNYAADTGSTNTIALTFSPAVAGYTAGLEITFKAAFTNTGAVLVNANGLGNKSLINSDGSALSSGQLGAGSVYKAAYDGTQFVGIFSSALAATAAQESAAVSITAFTSPGRQHNHPSAAKAWAVWSGTATGTVTALAAYNVASIVRIGAGTYSVALTTAFLTTAWVPIVSSGQAQIVVGAFTTAGVMITTSDSTGTQADAAFVMFTAYGNQ